MESRPVWGPFQPNRHSPPPQVIRKNYPSNPTSATYSFISMNHYAYSQIYVLPALIFPFVSHVLCVAMDTLPPQVAGPDANTNRYCHPWEIREWSAAGQQWIGGRSGDSDLRPIIRYRIRKPQRKFDFSIAPRYMSFHSDGRALRGEWLFLFNIKLRKKDWYQCPPHPPTHPPTWTWAVIFCVGGMDMLGCVFLDLNWKSAFLGVDYISFQNVNLSR